VNGILPAMAEGSPDPAFFGPLLLARDFAATVNFYQSILGLPVRGAPPYAKCVSNPSTFSIADGSWWAQVSGAENPVQGQTTVHDHVLTIQVNDVEETFERLMSLGTKFLSPPNSRPELGVRTAFLRDPDGRPVMLTSPLV
jgi:predicted enzyme related to lactoylglutathione lyase